MLEAYTEDGQLVRFRYKIDLKEAFATGKYFRENPKEKTRTIQRAKAVPKKKDLNKDEPQKSMEDLDQSLFEKENKINE
jgi:hypothetical protein